ncbi:hypothetical protein E2562_039141 [Oryza meyeriana var. granulata]|uniref:Uncharacterized protein n=1 Tax=Oryza meyeriana var. granulata TaxID=110450 RepID=A0A6G1DUE8_9ORYZ|nr:hypothetical protein E2562_039141 [Oryza meyeriana var. granulata]
MAKPRLLALLLLSALLALSFSQGRNVQLLKPVRRYGRWRSPLQGGGSLQQQEASAGGAGAAGIVSTVADYSEPKPNTNPRGGVLPPTDPNSPPAH